MSLDGNDYPDWLKSLQGDSPVLEDSEVKYIARVRNYIIQETETVPDLPPDRHLKKKLSVMQNNFADIVKYLKECPQSRNYFVRNYPPWRNVRDRTIMQLKEIAESVNKDCKDCSDSQEVASTVSIVGNLICLAFGSRTSRFLGSVLMGLGALTSAGISAVELDLLRKKIKAAEKIIQEDREYSEKLWKWISDVSYIQQALDTIRNIDVDANLMKAANDLYASYKKNKNNFDELQKMIRSHLKPFKISSEIIKESSEVVAILMSTLMLYERYRLFFIRAFQAYKSKIVLRAALDVFASSFKVTSAVGVGKSLELTDLQKWKLYTGIALDALNILLISESAKSTSKEAEEITKAAEKLEEEAEVFKDLYYAAYYS